MSNMYPSKKIGASAPNLQSKSVTATTSSQTVSPDSGYDGLSSVTVNPTPSQSKSASPNVSTNKTVSPDDGKLLSSVTITPLSHTGTYTPAANTAANDMGQYHDKRYVNTSGMIIPSGNKAITANGTGIDVKSYETVSVDVPAPTLDGDATTANVLAGKTFYSNSSTKLTGTMTNQGSPTRTISAGGSSYFAAGYYSGGYVYAGSSSLTETTLWTNSSPGSDFTSRTVTLSDSLSNYEYLKIVYRFKKSNTTTVCAIFKTSDVISYSTGSDNCMRSVFGARNTYNYCRIIKYISATQLSITDASCIGGSGTSNSSTIPVSIIGMNF